MIRNITLTICIISFYIFTLNGAVGGWNWNVNLNGTNYSSDASLSTFQPNGLILNGGWANSWQNMGDDVCHVILEYSINGANPIGIIIDYVGPHGSNPGDKYHSNQGYNINISNLNDGMHSLNITFRLFGRHSNTTCGTSGNLNEFTTGVLHTLNFSFILPVKFKNFTAQAQDHQTHLNWSTSSEINNDYFEVQFSKDGRFFSPIGEVKGQGNSIMEQSYTFIHENRSTNVSYYRLRQVDFDGKYEYSKTLKVSSNRDKDFVHYSLAPNPAQDYVRILGIESQPSQIEIMDNTGRVLKAMFTDGDISILDLNPGMYWIRIKNESYSQNLSFIKL